MQVTQLRISRRRLEYKWSNPSFQLEMIYEEIFFGLNIASYSQYFIYSIPYIYLFIWRCDLSMLVDCESLPVTSIKSASTRKYFTSIAIKPIHYLHSLLWQKKGNQKLIVSHLLELKIIIIHLHFCQISTITIYNRSIQRWRLLYSF